MHVFFSTVVRAAPVKQGGEVLRFQWGTKTIDARSPIYPQNPELDDPNPRGNTRGGRGIALVDDKVVVASYHTLRIYDRDLKHVRDVSHPLMVNLHEVYADQQGRVWVSCTGIDAVLEVDIQSGQVVSQFWPREMPAFQRALNIEPLAIDKRADNRGLFLSREHLEHPSHLHLNAITRWRGEIYALFSAFGVVANLDRGEVTLRDPVLRGTHNLIVEEDGTLITNDTVGRGVRIYDIKTGMLRSVIDLTAFAEVRRIAGANLVSAGPLRRAALKLNRTVLRRVVDNVGLLQRRLPAIPLFVRGLDAARDDLFVGVSPAAILRINRHTGELVDLYQHSTDVHVAVHGLRVMNS